MGTGDAEGHFAHVSAVPDTRATPKLPSKASFCTNQLKAKVAGVGSGADNGTDQLHSSEAKSPVVTAREPASDWWAPGMLHGQGALRN